MGETDIDISVRLEKESDFRNVEYITREAFWDIYRPGCCEHLIVHKLRKVTAFVKELCYVACANGEIIGNIVYSRAKIINDKGKEFEVLCMGPLSVVPVYQGKGVGSLLMNYSIKKARELGFKAAILFGNPAYYRKFGFVNAKEYGIQTSAGENLDAFMVLELFDGALEGVTGKFYENKVFEIDNEELEAFEKGFPYKEKHVTDSQLS